MARKDGGNNMQKDKVRTAVDRERDDITLKQLEVNIMKARLDLRDLELQYTEFRDKLEVQRIMEDDAYNRYNVMPTLDPPDAQATNVAPPPPENIQELYTTISARLSTIAESGIPHGLCMIPVTPPGFKTLVPLPFNEDILKPEGSVGHRHKGISYTARDIYGSIPCECPSSVKCTCNNDFFGLEPIEGGYRIPIINDNIDTLTLENDQPSANGENI